MNLVQNVIIDLKSAKVELLTSRYKLLALCFALAALCGFLFLPSEGYAQDEYFDVLIKNGTVYDGFSDHGRRWDIGIRDGKIAALGDLSGGRGKTEINAAGLTIAPGFIDIHTHSDFNPFLNSQSLHKIYQGVTTEVVGNCGMSAAPVFGRHEKEIQGVWLREGVVIPENISWQSVEEYAHALESRGLITHFALLVGHGNIRSAVMGFEPRKATEGEILQMRKLLRESLEQGALGFSLGLCYLPGIFADESEILALAEETKSAGGILAVHMRSEGKKLIESLEEILAVTRKTRVPLEISHLKAAGVRNWGKINQAFSLIELARKEGLVVWADAYPYAASAAELGVILPDEIYQSPERLKILSDSGKRDEVKRKITEEFEKNGTSLTRVVIAKTNLPAHQAYEGRSVADIAEAVHRDPLDVLIDLLAEENFQISAFFFSQNPEIVKRVIQKEYVSIGSDNIADFGPKPHPRVYGTFPRVIEKLVREEKLLSLGEAIRKMTSLPAAVLGLEKRGSLSLDYYADIVIFDLKEFKSEASYENPARLAQGMKYVLVNGKVVLEDGKGTGVLAGQVLRRKKGSVVT